MTTISPLPQRRKFPTRKLLLERKLILLADEKKPNSPVFRPNTIEIRGVDLTTRLRYSVSYYVPGFLRLSTWSWFDFDTPRESVLSPTHGGSEVFIRLALRITKNSLCGFYYALSQSNRFPFFFPSIFFFVLLRFLWIDVKYGRLQLLVFRYFVLFFRMNFIGWIFGRWRRGYFEGEWRR